MRRTLLPLAASALLGLAAILAAGGCGKASGPSSTAGRPNLLLITMDTTRADHLGAYGDAKALTPNLDRLAREGVACDQAIAVAPITLPSHVSMLTGLYPPRHGVRDNADFRLPAAETTIAEHLKAQGYATGAVVGAYVLAGSLGLDQGFDHYDEPKAPKVSKSLGAEVRFSPILEKTATEVTDAALRTLDALGDGPFFLWVHYYDPHAEYRPPEPFKGKFPGDPYDGEIAYMDSEIGRLLDRLRSRGLLDRTLVVAMADHGESLGEHGEDTHGLFVYDATVHVPLLWRMPSAIPAGGRYAGLASGVDLVPTALDLMGLPPMRGLHGKSLVAALRGDGKPESRDPVFSEAIYPDRLYGWSPLFALRTLERKFIEAPAPELYDLARDRGETDNLAPGRPDELQDWRRKLQAEFQEFGHPDPGAESEMTAEQKANLESLGYVQAPSGSTPRAEKPDPKRLVRVHNLILKARPLVALGKYEEVEAILKEALRGDPDNPAARALLGTLRFSKGKTEGLADLQAAAKAAPSVYETQWNLANALHLSGRYAEAAAAYRAAIALQPGSSQAHFALGNVLAAMKDPRSAVEEYRRAMDLGLATPQVTASFGAALADSGDLAGAEKALRAAVERDATLADAWNKLGVVEEKSGRKAEALRSYGRALVSNPGHADALFNRGKLRLLSGDRAGAKSDTDTLLGTHPDYAAGYLLRANLLLSEGDREGAKAALRKLVAMPKADPPLVASGRSLLQKLGG